MVVINQTVVRVGIADMNVVKAPTTIRTSGLGSCVGVVIYDSITKVAGLLHVMLPDSDLGKNDRINVAKFADTGVPALLEMMRQAGARRTGLKAKIAGGAQMFQFGSSDAIRIGPRNIEAVKEQLKKHAIPILAEDTGGSKGRTIEFNPQTLLLHVRTVNEEERAI